MPRAPAKTTGKAHPGYEEMITQALVHYNDKTGSSVPAITKYLRQEYSDLPESFERNLKLQLKRLVDSEKLVKVKASYRLSPKLRAQLKKKDKKPAATKKRSRSKSPSATDRAKSPSRGRSKSPSPKTTKSRSKSPAVRGRSKSPSASSKKTKTTTTTKKPKTTTKTASSPKKKAAPKKTTTKQKAVPQKASTYSSKPKPRTTQNSKHAGQEKGTRHLPVRKARADSNQPPCLLLLRHPFALTKGDIYPTLFLHHTVFILSNLRIEPTMIQNFSGNSKHIPAMPWLLTSTELPQEQPSASPNPQLTKLQLRGAFRDDMSIFNRLRVA
ncbi:Prenyltransferase and squalene oxidase repeat protein [Balamuthia mandrillaris]